MLQNAYLDAKIGADPAENEPRIASDGLGPLALLRTADPGAVSYTHLRAHET